MNSSIRFLGDYFVIGFRIFLPVFAGMLILNAVLGILAKVAPQMNMFSIGIQIKIIAGLLVLMIMVFLFPEVVDMVFNEIRLTMGNMMDGMHE